MVEKEPTKNSEGEKPRKPAGLSISLPDDETD